MNKLKNRFFAALAVGIGALSLYSCSESFLDEVDDRRYTETYFDTPEGLRQLSLGLPLAFRLQSTNEQISYVQFVRGTDEFTVGSDDANKAWNDYDANLQGTVLSSSNAANPGGWWNAAYYELAPVNTVIQKAPVVLEGQDDMTAILAKARFIRGWIYFLLTQQWGDVPLLLEPTVGVQREFPRAPKGDVLAAILEDFQFAYDNLTNAEAGTPGEITKDAAAHFLAKVLLYRQSEINGGAFASTKDADLTKALALCNEVIANRPLAPNFSDLWNYTGPDSPNEYLSEVLLSAQYTAESAGSTGPDAQVSFYWISWYSNGAWSGMKRNQGGGREYARLRATDYSMDVYDRVNDSRYWKSFGTTHIVNNPTQKSTTWGTRPLTNGQLGVAYIINDSDDASRFQLPEGNTIPQVNVSPPFILMSQDGGITYDSIRSRQIYPAGPGLNNLVPNVLPRYRVMKENPTEDTYAFARASANSVWPPLTKYLDGAMVSLTSPKGQRDIIKARVGETYLIAAEIKIRQGLYQDAIDMYINPLRARAQYSAGEDRARQIHGGQAYTSAHGNYASLPTTFSPVNTYYISNNIPETTAASNLQIGAYTALPAEDMEVITKLGYSSDYDRMMCLLLNERSRELMGEFFRWEDLARTKTLIARAYAYNDGVQNANSLAEHHYLRPIPKEYQDGLWLEGAPLTNDQKAALRNPGYAF